MRNLQVEKIQTKKVWYNGTSSLVEGDALCFNSDIGSTSIAGISGGTNTTASALRYAVVEAPKTANFKNFAGFVTASGKMTGPGIVTIVEPRGALCSVKVRKNGTTGTINSTLLGLVNGQTYLQSATNAIPAVALLQQTGDTSGTETVQAVMFGSPPTQGADMVDSLTAISGVTGTAGTSLNPDMTGDSSGEFTKAERLAIGSNIKSLATQLNEVIKELKQSGIMRMS